MQLGIKLREGMYEYFLTFMIRPTLGGRGASLKGRS